MFIDTFAERLMTYALGRGVEPYDHPVLRKSWPSCVRKPRWSTIILGIVKSTPFQMRRVSHADNRKSIPRRTFLRGAGAALALPMLDAMTPRWRRQGPADPHGIRRSPNGS